MHDTFVMESWQLVNLVTNFLYKYQDIDWNFLKCIGWPGMIMNQKECGQYLCRGMMQQFSLELKGGGLQEFSVSCIGVTAVSALRSDVSVRDGRGR